MDSVPDLLNHHFEVGNLSFTPASLLLGVGLLLVLNVAARILRRFLRERILPRAGVARGVSIALSTLIYYLVMTLGTLVLLRCLARSDSVRWAPSPMATAPSPFTTML